MTKTTAVLATLRIANAPSVISNVMLGYLLGCYHWGRPPTPWLDLTLLGLAGLCLYFAGNLANDWFDRDWDARHRPERALPAGRFTAQAYLTTALLLGILGLLAALPLGWWPFIAALLIGLLIIIYTALHKRTRWAVIPMGMCRAGLYLLGFLVSRPESALLDDPTLGGPHFREDFLTIAFVATHALGLLIYIAGLSLAARYESTEHPPHGMVMISRAMLLLPLVAMSCWWMADYPLAASLALLPFAIWLALSLTVFRKPVPRFVSALLAGIPLIDLIATVPLATTFVLPDGPVPPLAIAAVLIPLLAFISGRLLQRLAPAT